MSLFDRVRRLLVDDSADTGSQPDDLLAITDAAFEMEELGYQLVSQAALCFHAPDGFETTIAELQSIVDATSTETSAVHEDQHGFRWLVIGDESIEGLATSLQFAAETFQTEGGADELLAAVYGFEKDQRAYWIYTFDQGRFYPFVPDGTDSRDMKTEFKLQSVLGDTLPLEEDESKWYPLWPDRPGAHPWEQ